MSCSVMVLLHRQHRWLFLASRSVLRFLKHHIIQLQLPRRKSASGLTTHLGHPSIVTRASPWFRVIAMVSPFSSMAIHDSFVVVKEDVLRFEDA